MRRRRGSKQVPGGPRRRPVHNRVPLPADEDPRRDAGRPAFIVAANTALATETEGKALDLALLRQGIQAVLDDPSLGRYYIAEIDGKASAAHDHIEWSDWRNGLFLWIQSVYVLPATGAMAFPRPLWSPWELAADPRICGIRLYVDRATSAPRGLSRMGMHRSNYGVMETVYRGPESREDLTMLKPGTPAPISRCLTRTVANAACPRSFGGPLILYFYPPTSRRVHERSLRPPGPACQILLRSDVVGVSPQSPESHRRFREKYGLPFTLLSDESKSAIKAYGVDGPLGIGVRRATFLIDGKQRIADAVLADLRIGRHQAFVERAIAVRASRSASLPSG